VVSLGISDLGALIGKLRGSYTGRLLKLPCVTNVELEVMFGQGFFTSKEVAQPLWTSSQKPYSKASVVAEAYSNKEGLSP
jgi:hypothetical protein